MQSRTIVQWAFARISSAFCSVWSSFIAVGVVVCVICGLLLDFPVLVKAVLAGNLPVNDNNVVVAVVILLLSVATAVHCAWMRWPAASFRNKTSRESFFGDDRIPKRCKNAVILYECFSQLHDEARYVRSDSRRELLFQQLEIAMPQHVEAAGGLDARRRFTRIVKSARQTTNDPRIACDAAAPLVNSLLFDWVSSDGIELPLDD